MCKIVEYWLTCQHGFSLRHSTCGGTKHKHTRHGPTPACKSDSYLNIVLPMDCGPCQQTAFEEGWRNRLSSAELFLKKLKDRGFPGVPEVTALFEQLKDDFNTASWNTRTLFPHTRKARATRVSLGYLEKRISPLRYEVLPDDIPDPPDILDYSHPDYKYDFDYIASTDPLHPVDVNYANQFDDPESSWAPHHVSPEEFDQRSSDIGFDINEANALWAEDSPESQLTQVHWQESKANWTLETADPQCAKGRMGLALGTQMTSTEYEQKSADRIQMVIREFWSVIDNKNVNDQPVPYASPDKELLSNLDIINQSSEHNLVHTGLPTPPPTPPRLFLS